MIEIETLTTRRVTQKCETESFHCGNGSIESRIKGMYYATLLREGYGYEILSRTKKAETVIGYYFLRLTTMVGAYDNVDEELRSEVFDREYPFHYAAMEISFLAIHRERQNEGIGTRMLAQIIDSILLHSKTLPIRFIVIDALAEKVDWYIKIGFTPFKEAKKGAPTIKMYMDCIENEALDQYLKDSM